MPLNHHWLIGLYCVFVGATTVEGRERGVHVRHGVRRHALPSGIHVPRDSTSPRVYAQRWAGTLFTFRIHSIIQASSKRKSQGKHGKEYILKSRKTEEIDIFKQSIEWKWILALEIYLIEINSNKRQVENWKTLKNRQLEKNGAMLTPVLFYHVFSELVSLDFILEVMFDVGFENVKFSCTCIAVVAGADSIHHRHSRVVY